MVSCNLKKIFFSFSLVPYGTLLFKLIGYKSPAILLLKNLRWLSSLLSIFQLMSLSQRLKQKLREMESRLRQQANGNSGNSAHDNHKQDNGSEQATAGGAGIESSSSQKEDSVALSSVVVASGVKIFIRCQEDRTELYRVSYSSPSEEDSFKKWFADPQNKQDFMREHSITHIDVSGLKDTFLDSLI